MPTIIDELVVSLGIDSSKFKTQAQQAEATIKQTGDNAVKGSKNLEEQLRKTQQETQKRFKQTEDVAKQSSVSFGKFKNEVVGLFAVMSAGFGLQQFIKNVSNTDAGVGRLAANINISTEGLNKWQQAAIRAGGSAEATGQSLLGIRNEYEKMKTGQGSGIIPYLKALHVEWTDAKGDLIPMEELLNRLHKAVQGMDKTTANNLLAGVGIDQGTATLLEKNDIELNNIFGTVQRLGLITKGQAEAGISYQNALSNLQQSFGTLGRVIMTDAQEPFTKFINQISEWAAKPENAQLIEKTLSEGLKRFGNTILTISGFIKDFHVSADALAVFIGTGWVAMMTAGLSPVSAAVATIAAGFVAIHEAQKFLDPEQWSNNSIFWNGMSEKDQLGHWNSPAARKARGEPEVDPYTRNASDPSSWLKPSSLNTADTTLSQTKQNVLNTIAGPESGGAYDIKNGGSTFSGFDKFPSGIGPGGTSTAAGRYQFTEGTWNELAGKYGFKDFSPVNQDRAAWALAADRYRASTGGDLETDAKNPANSAKIAAALRATWPSMPGGSQSKQSQASFDARLFGGLGPSTYTDSLNRAENNPWETKSDVAKGHVSAYLNSLNRAEANPWEAKRSAANQNNVSSSSNETNINGPINVTLPNVTDSDGFAKGLGASLRRNGLVGQANTGLQ